MSTKRVLLAMVMLGITLLLSSLPTWATPQNPNLLWKSSSPAGPALYRSSFYIIERDNLRDGADNMNSIRNVSKAAAMATAGMRQLNQRVLDQDQGQWVVIGLEIQSDQLIYVDGPDALQFVGMFNGGRDSLMTSAEIMVSGNKQQTELFSTTNGQLMLHEGLYAAKSKFNGGRNLVVIFVHLLDCQSVQEITAIRPTAKWREG